MKDKIEFSAIWQFLTLSKRTKWVPMAWPSPYPYHVPLPPYPPNPKKHIDMHFTPPPPWAPLLIKQKLLRTHASISPNH